jgi:hypothetical protein
MNGNITREGIQLDLEWMHRVGIGGVQNFDAAYDTPQVVERRLVFMTPPWQDAFLFAARSAERLGLELAVAGSPGWSESGGPWVKPEDAMKKLVWSETRVTGGAGMTIRLPQPPRTVGPFQNVPVDRGPESYAGRPPAEPVPEFYRDVAVIAYRIPDNDRSMAELHPSVSTSSGNIDGGVLWDGDYQRAIHLSAEKNEAAWVQVDFGHPQTVQSMSVGLQNFFSGLGFTPRRVGATLESSMDGAVFRSVATAYDSSDQTSQGMSPTQETVTFAPVTARYFRLQLSMPPPTSQLPVALANLLGPVPREHQLSELILSPAPRVDHFEAKAGYFLDSGVASHFTRQVPVTEAIDPGEIVDLTAYLKRDGVLSWAAPAGRWAILRIGYSLLGVTNGPASAEGTGLEVDKLSRSAVSAYMDDYVGRYTAVVGSQLVGSHGLRALVSDSFEAGAQNWTDDLPAEFIHRRGYDLHRWLPALAGQIIGSAEMTDRFLWDFRRTLGELLAENHYGQITASLHARGMIHYGESHEINRAFIGDGMDTKHGVDIPMGAMWLPGSVVLQDQCDADLRESASVAHLYGQNLVAAESMTALGQPGVAYALSPQTLKPTADRELADGVNLFVLHTSVHQPTSGSPGVTLGPFGQWFTRHETWAEQASPWITYLARSSYLLQQGHYVADVVYFYGQDSNITALYGQSPPPVPRGYAFDFANARALSLLSVQDGFLVTPTGMRYQLLALAPRAHIMSFDVLKTIARLVEQGANVVGDKPDMTPSLADNVDEFRNLADTVWGNGTAGEHHYGFGRVISGESLAEAIARLKLMPDFRYSASRNDATVWFVHRRLTDGELYFINSRQTRSESIEAEFRVNGLVPELWHADSGLIEPAPYHRRSNSTIVPLALNPDDALFVVFRRHASQPEHNVAAPVRRLLDTVRGPWHVTFQEERGAPDQATFAQLQSWTSSPDPRIKYFSGTANYERPLTVPAEWLTLGRHVEIDLGTVKDLAEILINDRSAGILWKSPFRLDITGFLKPGLNKLTVQVTNLWANRLIGDKQPGAIQITSTTYNPYTANSSLLESGLLGPVKILTLHATRR